MIYRLRHYPYCGGFEDMMTGTREGCRSLAATVIKRHRGGFESPVSTITRGRRWELETAEDAAAISDYDGILVLDEIEDEEPDDDYFDLPEPPSYCEGCDMPFDEGELVDGLCDVCRHESDDEEDEDDEEA